LNRIYNYKVEGFLLIRDVMVESMEAVQYIKATYGMAEGIS
jgi:hypothetical protein